MAQRFEFPKLTKPGVYVIDFIGAGKSSRALVRKGRLRPVVGIGTAGQTVTVVDDAGKPGDEIKLAFDLDHFILIEPESGNVLGNGS